MNNIINYNYNGFVVRKNGNMFNFTDLLSEIEHLNIPNRRLLQFLTQKRIITYLNYTLNEKFTRNIKKEVKKLGYYKVTGARNTKCIWVNEVIFDLVFDVWLSKKNTMNILKYEDDFYDIIQELLNGISTIIPQYKIDIYRVDFYLKEHNIVIEYDEKYHDYKNKLIKDIDRENEIKKLTKCKIIRIKSEKIYEGINEILKEILYQKQNNICN